MVSKICPCVKSSFSYCVSNLLSKKTAMVAVPVIGLLAAAYLLTRKSSNISAKNPGAQQPVQKSQSSQKSQPVQKSQPRRKPQSRQRQEQQRLQEQQKLQKQRQEPQQPSQVSEEPSRSQVVKMDPFSYEALIQVYSGPNVENFEEIPKKNKMNRIIMLIPCIEKGKFSEVEKELFSCLDWCHRQKVGASLVNDFENIQDLALLKLGKPQPRFSGFSNAEFRVKRFIQAVCDEQQRRETQLREQKQLLMEKEAHRTAFSAESLAPDTLQVFADAVFKEFSCAGIEVMEGSIEKSLKILNRQIENSYGNSLGIFTNIHKLMKCHAAICIKRVLEFQESSPEGNKLELFLCETGEDNQMQYKDPMGRHTFELLNLFHDKFVDKPWSKWILKDKDKIEFREEILLTYENFVDILDQFISIETIPKLDQLIDAIDVKL